MAFHGKSYDEILEGKISWHNLVNPDEEGKWRIRIYPTPESLDKINKLKEEGLLNVLKKDEEGYNMAFTRHQKKTFKGVDKTFTPPIVLDKEGHPTIGQGIGHGSDVRIKLQIYSYPRTGHQGRGIAARLEAVRILNLIPYDMKRDMNVNDFRQVKGMGMVDPPVSEDIF